MKTLEIGLDGFKLPIELATGSIAILATKGSGKSYTAAVMAEELIERGVPVIIIDPTGAHWGLKSSATGKSAGYQVTIFGGDHADIALEKGSGEVLAKWFVDRRFCGILDISHFRKAEIFSFLTPFLETLYRLNRQPVHLIADEADLYAPQFTGKSGGLIPQCLGAMEDIVRRGRKNGIGSTLITQRPASINKDVLTQCDCLMALRIGHPRDIEPVMEWIEMNGDLEKAKEMLASLPSMPTGTAWIWAPRMGIFERVKIRKRTTFDSSRTPEIGERMMEPTAFAKIDLEALGKEIAETVQQGKENDPRELKTRISKLQGELAAKEAELKVKAAIVKVETRDVLILTAAQDTQLAACHRTLGNAESELTEARLTLEMLQMDIAAIKDKQREVPAAAKPVVAWIPMKSHPHVRKLTPLSEGAPQLGACQRAILAAASTRYPKASSRSQLAVISGYSMTSSSFANALSALRTAELISGHGDAIELTAKGLSLAPPAAPMDGETTRQLWLGKLGLCERMILGVAIKAYPEGMDKEAMAQETGYSATSSSFANALSKLRTLELITRGHAIRATETLFP